MPDVRASLSLDGQWSLVPDPGRRLQADSLPAGVPVVVPGCWEAQLDEPYGIVTAWYRRSLEVPEDWPDGRLVLVFGAVMYAADVYVNGALLGSHEGGYTAFEIDATGHLRPGERSELAVRVGNPLNVIDDYPVFPEADLQPLQDAVDAMSPNRLPPIGEIPHGKQTWYSSQSGIWQSVRLERRPTPALGGIRVIPDVPGSRALVHWTLDDASPAERPAGLRLRLEVADPDDRVAAAAEVALQPGSGAGDVAVALDEVRLWDIGAPHLYTLLAQLVDADGNAVDALDVRFGMREIRTEGGRILLNGRPIYLLGVLDQDLYPDTISGPPSKAFLVDQMRRTREMGLNLLRCHIKVPDPAYLDAADEAGLLVWCELPNWLRFTPAAAERGRRTLRDMVEQLGNHPSIVIWTIVNEDWGTRVRAAADHRRWLLETYAWLRELDPTRLVVDNSACEADPAPNFHVRSDLADFHVYFAAPDHAARWRERIAEFAGRPPWLWSPHGDARPRGDEPLVLSEFGSWGLPHPDRLTDGAGGDPWWFTTGRGYFRPAGWQARFHELGLDRVWPSLGQLAEATQWHQFDALQYQIGELRRHDAIQGYVITELCDANWEANGLLDDRRGRKAYHDRLATLNAPDVVVADLARRDVPGGGRLLADVTVSSYGRPAGGGSLRWWLTIQGADHGAAGAPIDQWPDGGARVVGSIDLAVPDVERATDAVLHVVAADDAGVERARNDYRLAVVPARTPDGGPLALTVADPEQSGLERRLGALGHHALAGGAAAPGAVVVTTRLDRDRLAAVDAGGHALVLARDPDALAPDLPLDRPVAVHPRSRWHPDWPGQSPWDGDWVTAWSWIRHDRLPGLPLRNPLDFAYQEVIPDHVLTGIDPDRHLDEVSAGMFAGWVHAPAGLVWTFPQGRGRLTVTTFRVAPESGPLASLLLDRLIRLAAAPAGAAAR